MISRYREINSRYREFVRYFPISGNHRKTLVFSNDTTITVHPGHVCSSVRAKIEYGGSRRVARLSQWFLTSIVLLGRCRIMSETLKLGGKFCGKKKPFSLNDMAHYIFDGLTNQTTAYIVVHCWQRITLEQIGSTAADFPISGNDFRISGIPFISRYREMNSRYRELIFGYREMALISRYRELFPDIEKYISWYPEIIPDIPISEIRIPDIRNWFPDIGNYFPISGIRFPDIGK